jgi:hypothetical protein
VRTFIVLGWLLALLCSAPSSVSAQCLGDFNGDGKVTVNELVTAVDNALNGRQITSRFVDNADGTITDHKTRLMWEKKVALDGKLDYANLHDADDYYPWSGYCTVTSNHCQPTAAASAACTAGVEGDPTGCAACTGGDGTCNAARTIWTWVGDLNAGSFAGHADWRVPKRAELQSIIDYNASTSPVVNAAFDGASCGGACTDVTAAACSCTKTPTYWSSSTFVLDPIAAWLVDFYGGSVGVTDGADIVHVRAVRGP